MRCFLLKTWNLFFFENLKIIGGKLLPGKFFWPNFRGKLSTGGKLSYPKFQPGGLLPIRYELEWCKFGVLPSSASHYFQN